MVCHEELFIKPLKAEKDYLLTYVACLVACALKCPLLVMKARLSDIWTNKSLT